MDILIAIIAGAVGVLIGYFFFYWRYENRELVNELRSNNLELKHMFRQTDHDRLEYEQQNIILKEEITDLYKKNDDLTYIVSELSRYYYHMKKVSGKMEELSAELKQPLGDLDSTIGLYTRPGDQQEEQEFTYKLSNNDEEKGSFF